MYGASTDSPHKPTSRLTKLAKKLRANAGEIGSLYRLRDFAILLILPVVLTILQVALTDSQKLALNLDVAHPQLYQFLTAGFVHIDVWHYAGNTATILAVMLLQFLLMANLGKKNNYFLYLVVIWLLVPVMGSIYAFVGYRLMGPQDALVCGSSAIAASLLVSTPVPIFLYYQHEQRKRKNDDRITRREIIKLFAAVQIFIFTSFALVLLFVYKLPAYTGWYNWILILLILAMGLFFKDYIVGFTRMFSNVSSNPFFSIAIIGLLGLFAITPFLIFPITFPGSVDIYGHDEGAVFGILLAGIFLKWSIWWDLVSKFSGIIRRQKEAPLMKE